MIWGQVWCLSGEGNGNPLQYSCLENPMDGGTWKAAVHGVAKSRTRLSDFTFTFYFHASEKEMATHSSVLTWRIPGMGVSSGLPSMGSQRVGHDWSDLAAAAVQLLQNHLLQRLSLTPLNCFCLCWKSVGHICVPLYLTSLICSVAVLIYLYTNISLSWSQYLYSKSSGSVSPKWNTSSLLT